MEAPLDSAPSRRLRRLYSDRDLSSLDEVLLSAEESRHALKSLRLKLGEHCFLVDGSGCEAEARLEQIQEDRALFQILSRRMEARGFSIPVTVLPAFIKKGKMDILVEKAQEFGVAHFQPLMCERSEFSVSADRFEAVTDRWEKIAKEAAKQSGALQVLSIDKPVKFEKALAGLDSDSLVLIFHTHAPAEDWVEVALRLRESAEQKKYREVFVLIGPEGGFSSQEIQHALDLKHPHLKVIRMVATVLKADTAFVAALAGVAFFLKGNS